MSGEPDPKIKPRGPRRRARHVATRAEWRRVVELVDAESVHCPGCGIRLKDENAMPRVVISYHHLVPRDLLGADVPQNVMLIGGTGTIGCHGIYTSKQEGEDCLGHRRTWEEIAANIRARLPSEKKAYILATKGIVFLDRYYPEGTP